MGRRHLKLAVALMVAGASTAPAACGPSTTMTIAGADTSAATTEPTPAEPANEPTPPALPGFGAPAGAAPSVEALTWGQHGRLRIGYGDGYWAGVDPGAHQADVDQVTSQSVPVVALSPAGKLAVVRSDPPMVIRLRDHQTVMRLGEVADFDAAGFWDDGAGVYVAETSGKLHVWNQSEDTLDGVSMTDLKKFISRQRPDMTANLSAIAGPVVSARRRLVLATDAGTVLVWDGRRPEQLETLVELKSAARSFGPAGSNLALTTAAGALRVVDMDTASYRPWSMTERARLVAASANFADGFAVVDDHSVGVRSFADGAYQWQRRLSGPAEPCGLKMSADGQHLAVCVDSAIIVVDPHTGEPIGAVRRRGQTMQWAD